MRRLRILMIGPYPIQPGRLVGGVEAVNSVLASALAAESRVEEVGVLSFQDENVKPLRVRIGESLTVWQLPKQRRPLLTRAWRERWYARRVVRDFKPDIVHGHGILLPGEVATTLPYPSVVTVHGVEQVEARLDAGGRLDRQLRTALVTATVRRVLRKARAVISISNYDATVLEKAIHGQHFHIPNPVAPHFFAKTDCHAERPILVFAGVLSPRKNVEGLLRSFARAKTQSPDSELVLVGPSGDDRYAERLRGLVSSLQIQHAVTFAGHVETEDLVKHMQRARAVVLFSHEETLPTVLAQAMALGKAVVASRVGGVAEMVTDGASGLLVPAGDEAALASSLVSLLNAPERAREMGQRGHALALSRWEAGTIARQTVDVYGKILNAASHAHSHEYRFGRMPTRGRVLSGS
jgi:glycosyltransferase involved in cell wall biosynthesis